jgi:hypothetical protein
MSHDDLFNIISDLVMCHSPSGAEDEINQRLMAELAQLGVDHWRDEADNVIAKLPGRDDSRAIAITALVCVARAELAAYLLYRVLRREPLPDGFLQQHILEATLPDGTRWAMDACVVVRVEGGLITRLDEYLDSAKSGALRKFGR